MLLFSFLILGVLGISGCVDNSDNSTAVSTADTLNVYDLTFTETSSGKVRINGKIQNNGSSPIDRGSVTITITDKDGNAMNGNISSGSYSFNNLTPGKVINFRITLPQQQIPNKFTYQISTITTSGF